MDSDKSLWLNSGRVPHDARFRSLPYMAHSIDRQGYLINVSDLWANRLGFEHDEMIGRKSVDFLTPKSRMDAQEIHLPKFFKTGVMPYTRYDFVHKEGEIVPVIMSAHSESKDGKIARSMAIIFDNGITQRARDLASICAQLLQEDKLVEDPEVLRRIDDAMQSLRSYLPK